MCLHMQKSIQPAMNLLCSLLFYLPRICKQKEAGVLWRSPYHVENCCDFLWSSGISVTFSNSHFFDYTTLEHFSKKNYTLRGMFKKVVFWYFQCLEIIEKTFAWEKILPCMLREVGDSSVLHHIKASEKIISSSPNYLTISKLYFTK